MSNEYIDLHSVFLDIIDSLKKDYLESSSDYFIQTRSFVFNNFYRVKPLFSISPGLAKPLLFIDAGFKIHELDVAVIIPVQISGLLRNENGDLLSIDKLISKPVVDTLVIYASRIRSGDRYVFSTSIKCLSSKTILFENRSVCEETSIELNRLIREMISYKRLRTPRFFTKLAKYIEGLVEIAYGLKLRRILIDELGYEPLVVYDGSLLRWFSIRRKGFDIDGLDIISKIINEEPGDLKKELLSVIGLSKTTRFTTIARSYGLFLLHKESSISGRGLYTEINVEKLNIVREKLLEVLHGYAAQDYVDETIKLFNRIVYDVHSVYVTRFPITSDYLNVFIADLYTLSEVISLNKSDVVVNYDEANRVNERLSYIVPNLYTYRSKLYGEPPYGYMEVDGFIRYGKLVSSVFEELLLRTMSSVDEPLMKPLIQAFSSTMRMRYGYG